VLCCSYDNSSQTDLAQAFVITFLINNKLDEDYLDVAFDWEYKMVELMKQIEAAHPELRITFYTESGIEVELARDATSDLITVSISYLVMLIYVSLALGRFSSWRRFVIDTKFTLGIAGVLICIFSVLVSVGFFRCAAEAEGQPARAPQRETRLTAAARVFIRSRGCPLGAARAASRPRSSSPRSFPSWSWPSASTTSLSW